MTINDQNAHRGRTEPAIRSATQRETEDDTPLSQMPSPEDRGQPTLSTQSTQGDGNGNLPIAPMTVAVTAAEDPESIGWPNRAVAATATDRPSEGDENYLVGGPTAMRTSATTSTEATANSGDGNGNLSGVPTVNSIGWPNKTVSSTSGIANPPNDGHGSPAVESIRTLIGWPPRLSTSRLSAASDPGDGNGSTAGAPTTASIETLNRVVESTTGTTVDSGDDHGNHATVPSAGDDTTVANRAAMHPSSPAVVAPSDGNGNLPTPEPVVPFDGNGNHARRAQETVTPGNDVHPNSQERAGPVPSSGASQTVAGSNASAIISSTGSSTIHFTVAIQQHQQARPVTLSFDIHVDAPEGVSVSVTSSVNNSGAS